MADSPLPLAERPTRGRYRAMAFLCGLSFLTYFDRVCMVRAQNEIGQELNLTAIDLGWVMGAFWLAYAVFEIPGGWLGDRFGSRLALIRIVLMWSLFTALTGAAAGFRSLLMFRFLFGIGEAGAYPNMARVQAAWLPVAARPRAGGLLWLMARWGGAFSPLLYGGLLTAFSSGPVRNLLSAIGGSWLAEVSSWRLAFCAAGLVGIVWCLAFARWFRDDPSKSPGVNSAELALIRGGRAETEQVGESERLDRATWRALFTSGSLWAIGLMYLCVSFGWSFYITWLPKYLKELHDIDYADSEVMTGLPLFCGGIACLAGGLFYDRWLARRRNQWLARAALPVAGYLVAAAAMFAVQHVTSVEWAVTLVCLAAAANDFGQAANWATIVDVGGRYAGVAAGLVNLVGNQGNFLQPPTGAWIHTEYGWPTLFATYACTYLAAAAMWLWIDPRRTFYDRRRNGG